LINPIDPIKRDWLRYLRKEKKLTVRGIAEIFGISHQHYSDIENGRRNPSIELSLKMAEFLGEPIESFLEDRTKFTKGEN
jgi:transcriptional regulator with XRE-family HTH domain